MTRSQATPASSQIIAMERFEVAGFEPVDPYDETRKGAPLYRLKEPE